MRNSVHSLTVLANFSGCNLTIKSLCCDVTDPSILLFTILYMSKGGGGGVLAVMLLTLITRLISKTFLSGCNITLQGGKLQMPKEMIATV